MIIIGRILMMTCQQVSIILGPQDDDLDSYLPNQAGLLSRCWGDYTNRRNIGITACEI